MLSGEIAVKNNHYYNNHYYYELELVSVIIGISDRPAQEIRFLLQTTV